MLCRYKKKLHLIPIKLVAFLSMVCILLFSCSRGKDTLQEGLNKSLLSAVGNGDFQKAEKFFALGANINSADSEWRTPLIIASEIHSLAMVDWLIQKQAHLNLSNVDGVTALMIAASNGDINILNALIAAGASAVMYAIASKSLACVRSLLKENVALHFTYSKLVHGFRKPMFVFYDSLELANKVGSIAIINLVEKAIKRKASGFNLSKPLWQALKLEDDRLAEKVLDLGANPNSLSPSSFFYESSFPLIFAAEKNLPEISRLLIGYGASINHIKNNMNALMLADRSSMNCKRRHLNKRKTPKPL